MASAKLSALTATPSVAAGDLFYTVDVSDMTDDSSGSSRKATAAQLQAYLQPSTKSAYAAGTVYTLTATSALLDFGTTDPSITLDVDGRWLIEARANIQNNAATFAASRTVTVKVRDTTNSADVTNATDNFQTGTVTAVTGQAGNPQIAAELLVSGSTAVQLWGAVSVVPTAGSIQAVVGGTWIRATYLGPA